MTINYQQKRLAQLTNIDIVRLNTISRGVDHN